MGTETADVGAAADRNTHADGTRSHDHHRHMMADFKRRFIVTLVLTLPVLALSPTLKGWFGGIGRYRMNCRYSSPLQP